MKLLIETSTKNYTYNLADGVILPIANFAVESLCYYTVDEIIKIKKENNCLVFVKMNKNLFNDDIPKVKEILLKLDNIIDGVFFYDLAILELKKELNLNLDLIWNQTHMVNNYRTCDYYYSKGVKYALLSKEITLDEILEIIKLSKINCMVEAVSRPSVAFSKRKLLTNYYHDLGKKGKDNLKIFEKGTSTYYDVIEDQNGTSFYLDNVTNATPIIKDLYDGGCPFIIFREYGIDNFNELVTDTMNYLKDKCKDDNYVSKYKKLGDSTNFFFKKTIYKVK